MLSISPKNSLFFLSGQTSRVNILILAFGKIYNLKSTFLLTLFTLRIVPEGISIMVYLLGNLCLGIA